MENTVILSVRSGKGGSGRGGAALQGGRLSAPCILWEVFPAGTGLVVRLGAGYWQAPGVSCRGGSDGTAALLAPSGVVVALLDETAQTPGR